MNNLLVTGSQGFIGSYIIDYFEERYNCMGLSRSTGFDIVNYDNLKQISFNPDIIIHSAGYLGNDFETSFQTNVVGTLNVCKFAKDKGIKHFILISSIFVFNNLENEYYNNYGMSKKQSEEITEQFCKENDINLTILRLSQVYDPARKSKESQKMLYYFIDSIYKTKKVNIFGSKDPLRNYIHINDVIEIIDDVVEMKTFGTFNVINEKSSSISEISKIIFKIHNLDININYLKEKDNILSVYIPSTNLYDKKNNYIPLLEGIREIIKYGQ